MRKTLTLFLIIMFLTAPSLIVSEQVSATSVANNSLTGGANLLWNFTTSNGVWSAPTIDNGVLYVGCEDVIYTGTQVSYAGNLYALNAANGDKLWNYSIADGGSSPAVADGRVYVGSFDGNVYAFNATNGVKLWSYPAGDLVSSSPAVANGIVYIGLSNGSLVALNGITGEEAWKHNSSGGVGSPIVKDGVVFASSIAFIPISIFTGQVYALNATNGKVLWDFSANSSVSFPTIIGETVYVGVGSNVYALSSFNGSQLWTNSIVNKQVSLNPTVLRPTAVLDNVLFVSSEDGSVYALNTNNGEKIWNQSLGNGKQIETSPAVANGAVYVGSDDGNLYALNATNGDILWNYTISDRDYAVQSSPAVANGIVYIGSGARNVYAFVNPVNSNTSAYPIPIIIVVALVIVVVLLVIILIFKRLKSKTPPSRESAHGGRFTISSSNMFSFPSYFFV